MYPCSCKLTILKLCVDSTIFICSNKSLLNVEIKIIKNIDRKQTTKDNYFEDYSDNILKKKTITI